MKKRRPAKGQLVVVYWIDAHTYDPWLNEEAKTAAVIGKPSECQTVGWVVSTKGKVLCIAASRGLQQEDATTDWGSRWFIPWGMVQKVVLLEEAPVAAPSSVKNDNPSAA